MEEGRKKKSVSIAYKTQRGSMRDVVRKIIVSSLLLDVVAFCRGGGKHSFRGREQVVRRDCKQASRRPDMSAIGGAGMAWPKGWRDVDEGWGGVGYLLELVHSRCECGVGVMERRRERDVDE